MKTIVLLESIHQVMRAEKILKAWGIRIDLIPVPREIGSDCGMAIELAEEAEEEAIRVLKDNRVPVGQWYTRDTKGAFQRRTR